MEFDTFNSLKPTMVKTLKEALFEETKTPSGAPIPCEIYIPLHNIRAEDDEANTATASVTYVVKCPSEKKHTVHIKFRFDNKGKYLAGSMSYV